MKLWFSIKNQYFCELWQTLEEFGFKWWLFPGLWFVQDEFFLRVLELVQNPLQQQTCKGTLLSSFISALPFSSFLIFILSSIIFEWFLCWFRLPKNIIKVKSIWKLIKSRAEVVSVDVTLIHYLEGCWKLHYHMHAGSDW